MFARALLSFVALPGVFVVMVPMVWLFATSHSRLDQPLGLGDAMNALEVKIPPVALVLGLAGVMWLVARFFPFLSVPFPGQTVVVAALAAAGALISLGGVIAFRHARTTVDPTKPEKSTTLVASGVYRVSRNPMYLGFLLVLAAWAAHLANLLAVLALPVFVAYMNRFQIVPEERALRAKFGTAFGEYERSVRRWL